MEDLMMKGIWEATMLTTTMTKMMMTEQGEREGGGMTTMTMAMTEASMAESRAKTMRGILTCQHLWCC
jgi:hypothetical protein